MKTPTSFISYAAPFLITTAFFVFGFFYIPEVGVSIATVLLISAGIAGLIFFTRIMKKYTNVEKIVTAGNARTIYLLAIVFFSLFLNGLGFILWRTDPFWVKLSYIQDEANFSLVVTVTVICFLLFLSALNLCYRTLKVLNA